MYFFDTDVKKNVNHDIRKEIRGALVSGDGTNLLIFIVFSLSPSLYHNFSSKRARNKLYPSHRCFGVKKGVTVHVMGLGSVLVDNFETSGKKLNDKMKVVSEREALNMMNPIVAVISRTGRPLTDSIPD